MTTDTKQKPKRAPPHVRSAVLALEEHLAGGVVFHFSTIQGALVVVTKDPALKSAIVDAIVERTSR